MTTLQRQFDDATAAVRAAMQRAQDLMHSGKTYTDPEVVAEIESSEGAMRARDNFARLMTVEAEEAERLERENRLQDPPNRAMDVRAETFNATPEYIRAANAWLREAGLAKRNDYTASPEIMTAIEHGRERNALTTVSDSGGGILVSPDMLGGLEIRKPGVSQIIPFCNVFPTQKDSVRRRRVKRNATYGSIYTSDFVGSWTGEIPSASAGQNEPGFGYWEAKISKYRAMARVSVDEAEDADFDVMAFLSEDGPRNSQLALEYAVLVGTGIGNEPAGVFKHPTATSNPTEAQILAVDIEGSTSNTISNSTSNLGSASKLMTLNYSLPIQYRVNARYVMNSATLRKSRLLVDANGNFIWKAGFSGDPDDFFGKPVAISEWCPDDGSDGNLPILYGDLSAIAVPIRKGVSITIASERYVDTDEIGFFLHQRAGVAVKNCDALRFGIV